MAGRRLRSRGLRLLEKVPHAGMVDAAFWIWFPFFRKILAWLTPQKRYKTY
jgi:hypothetical protein